MALNNYIFSSVFSEYITGLIRMKQNSGYIYETGKYILTRFDRFCISKNVEKPVITKELSMDWAVWISGEGKRTRASRISVLRQLALYMTSLGYDCYIPRMFSFNKSRLPYVMNNAEIQAFIKVCDNYIPQINAERSLALSEEYRVLFRFILCCGLRISEARKLKLEDMDFDNCTAVIRQSKGDKDRLIYIAQDVVDMCRMMVRTMHEKHKFYSDYLFPSSDPSKPLQVSSINLKFREFWKKTPYAGNDKAPTVHSLRYSFVVSRMNSWMENGEDLKALMPYLSKYLGHSSTDNTYYYYHQIESAFRIVRQKDAISENIIPEVQNEK